ncbi:MAG: hypothetical protein GF365_03975 [Candidatus Buchananbacteria bacterium]|nr:hypothetical protein [Candidatus Buchananbacteria bacterium]
MPKKIFFLLIIIIVILGFVLFFYFDRDTEQQIIQEQINQANYCQQTSDCVQLTGQCPFGCYIYVNIDEAARIQKLIDDYESDCIYGCIEPPEFECRDNKCTEILE